MNYWQELYDAYVPEPYTILGVRLQPLTIGHIILLHRFQSPFFVDFDKGISIDDLAFGILVCSNTYKEALRIITDEDLLLKSLYKLGRKQVKWYRPFKSIVDKNFPAKIQMFMEYIKDNSKTPAFQVAETKTANDDNPLPTLHIIRTSLMRYLNYTAETVMDVPFVLAQYEYLTVMQMENPQIKILPDGFIESIEKQMQEMQEYYTKNPIQII